jgi:hypothetical protein
LVKNADEFLRLFRFFLYSHHYMTLPEPIQKVAFLFRFWVFFQAAFSGAILKSQPTVRGHTLTRCPLPGWQVRSAPCPPQKP